MVNKNAHYFAILKNSFVLVLQNKQEIPTIVMAKIQIKSENPLVWEEYF